MPYLLEATGPVLIGTSGGSTPNEQYGVGVFGPAIYGANNRTGLSDTAASTFDTFDAARVLLQSIAISYPDNEYRIAEVQLSAADVALGVVVD